MADRRGTEAGISTHGTNDTARDGRLFEPAEHGGQPASRRPATEAPVEIGGPSGPEPTRYGDWERNGRCTDF